MASEAIAVPARYGSRIERGNEMIMRPAWRSRTAPRRRRLAASITTLVVAAVGFATMALVMAGLGAIAAPAAVRAALWYLPTGAALIWALRHPAPAEVSEDGADNWLVFSIRSTMVGEGEARPRPARAIAAVVLGAPVAWALLVVGALALAGVG